MAKHHPDQGGDHEHAVLINEAWAVLGNATRRAEYDERRAKAAKARTGTKPSIRCPFCGNTTPQGELSCSRCLAPLTRVKPPAAGSTASADERRKLPRVSRADWARMQLQWQGEPIDIRLRNLSLEGVSFYSGATLVPGARVRVTAAAFEAIVDVIRCEKSGTIYVAQGSFVTVRFAGKGGFVYTTA